MSFQVWYFRIRIVVPIYRNITIVAIVTVLINQEILTFIAILICVAVAKVWSPSAHAHCINRTCVLLPYRWYVD